MEYKELIAGKIVEELRQLTKQIELAYKPTSEFDLSSVGCSGVYFDPADQVIIYLDRIKKLHELAQDSRSIQDVLIDSYLKKDDRYDEDEN